MRCLRCGYCCKNLAVMIVDDPEKGISSDNIVFHEGLNTACKHLKGEKPGEFSCALHDYSWYTETPCFSHNQIEMKESNCRIGEYFLKESS